MDPVSQAVVGAAFAQSAASRTELLRIATLAGVLGGMAPDLDVLIRSDSDPLLFLEYHRQFTHSVFFIPFGGLIVSAFLYLFLRTRVEFRTLYFFATVGYATHGFLDACTSYGTQLYWPVTDYREAWDIISIIDPLFTAPLILLVVAGFFLRKKRYSVIALLWLTSYLGLGLWQQSRGLEVLQQIAASRGHVPERLIVKPSFANLVVWKLLYEYEGRYYVDAVRLAHTVTVYPGASIAKLDDDSLAGASALQRADVERFRWFSDGFLARNPSRPALIGDARYSLLPNTVEPLWSIYLQPDEPQRHVRYVTQRQNVESAQHTLKQMITGHH